MVILQMLGEVPVICETPLIASAGVPKDLTQRRWLWLHCS